LIALGAAVRLPFLLDSLFIPVDGDTAIIGLMARHRVWTGTMWGQPYGSPVESWLALPIVELLGAPRLSIRLTYFLLSVALVPLAWGMARCLDRRAGLPAALLLACPPAVLVSYGALPPPLYPTVILLTGAALLAALLTAETLSRPGPGWVPGLFVWATLCALALWTHLVAAVAVGAGALLLLARARFRPGRAIAVLAVAGATAAPFLLLAASEPGSVGIARSTLEHARRVLPQMPYPLLELIGGRVWVVSAGDHEVVSPPLVQGALVLLYASAVLLALARRRQAAVFALGGAFALTVAIFPFPVRSDLAGVRFLTPAYLPLAVLVAVGATAGLGRAAWIPVALLVGLQALPLPGLLRYWHDARDSSAFFPDCSDARHTMEAFGLRRGYASYNTAYCITWESGERLVASQPWNERFVHHPLPFLDEVRFASSAIAWVLRPGYDYRGVPPPEEFERQLRRAGGSWRRRDVGGTLVYHSFVPPFSPSVTPLEGAGAAGDADPTTRVLEPARGPSTYRVPVPRPLYGLTFLAGTQRPLLPRSLKVEVSEDGAAFEQVLRRRRDREHVKLLWLNGQPQYPMDDRVISARLGGQRVSAIRITPLGDQGPWSLAEVLLHESPGTAPWRSLVGLDSTWARRLDELQREPRPEDAVWYDQLVLASDHR
jgi:hypothetical protein